MTEHRPIAPAKAVAFLEEAEIADARRLLADMAAAGELRSYAAVQEETDHAGAVTTKRGAALSPAVWRRIISEDQADDVWHGGTVRLAAAELKGGLPEVHVTGISFAAAGLHRLVEQHGFECRKQVGRTAVPRAGFVATADIPPAAVARSAPVPAPTVSPDAVAVTVKQAKAMLNIGHTTLYKLLNMGELERAPSSAGTRITTESVRRYAGLSG